MESRTDYYIIPYAFLIIITLNFEAGSAVWCRLVLNSQSSSLYIPRARMTGVNCHTWLPYGFGFYK
jgi:hypothetical protein